MNAQCSPEPYRLTADGRLEKSGLYHQMKSFIPSCIGTPSITING